MTYICESILILFICTFVIEYGTVSSSIAINWVKYHFEGESVAERCSAEDTQFVKDAVKNPLACSKICNDDDECNSFSFQADDQKCSGCREFFKPIPPTNSTGFIHFSKRALASDCKEILERNMFADSGVYTIAISGNKTLRVYCDMTTNGGGWTVFQNRFDGSVNFERNFTTYENGFGDINGEFWLGLKFIQTLTEKPSEFRYDLDFDDHNPLYERFGRFQLTGAQYTLSIDNEALDYSGISYPLGEQFSICNGAPFVAFVYGPEITCDIGGRGGWWYCNQRCDYNFNLNIVYGTEIFIKQDSSFEISKIIESSRMMIRRI